MSVKVRGGNESQRRRADDEGWLCEVALRGSQFFDWVDKRQIDAWSVLVFSLWMTYEVLEWGMDFANGHPEMDGLKMAAIVGAIVAPWVTMQAALVKFYFDARSGTFLPKLVAPLTLASK